MTTPLYALMGFFFWTMLLLTGIAVARTAQVLSGNATPSSFPAGVPHGSDPYWRLNRAHANCLENLPLFAAVVLTAAVAGVTSGTFDSLARVYVFARVGQSLAHLSSGSDVAINVRFTFFLVQVVAIVWMAWIVVR
jgi:uncharacterized MAPEG superfamily protein